MKININGERVVMQLQRSIHPKDWDSKRAKVIGRSHEAREFNDYIDSVITRTRQKYSELITMHDTVTGKNAEIVPCSSEQIHPTSSG